MLKALKNRLNNRKGFTLIELIVVIAIIAILAAVLIPRFTGFTESARQKSAVSDARNALVAIEALVAEGNATVTQAQVQTYTGKTFAGTIAFNATNPATFTYTVLIPAATGDTYIVDVANGTIDTTFLAPGAGVTGSTSTGLS